MIGLRAVLAASLLLSSPGWAQEPPAPGVSKAPIARAAVGVVDRLGAEGDKSTALAMDLTVGGELALAGWPQGIGPVLGAELGYGWDGGGFQGAQVALGAGYGHRMLFVSYHPRLLLGTMGQGTAVGMRNGLAVHALADIFSAEIGHQLLHDNGPLRHDVRLMLGINPAGLVSAFSRYWRGRPS